MRVLLAGASGFLGSRLTRRLAQRGDDVVRLVRRDPCTADELRWDPSSGTLDPRSLAGVDAVINLAGANVGARRWTGAYRRTIRDSRVDTTRTLAMALAAAARAGPPASVNGGPPASVNGGPPASVYGDPPAAPRVLINASAVGYYGDTGDRVVDERSPAGQGFLAEVCVAWEAATEPARAAGVRIVQMRTGLPLSRSGGLLKPLLLPFRLGLGGRLGRGAQYLPWISMIDWLAGTEHALDRDDLAGAVNFTAPDPVTNAAFTKALGRVLHRPTALPVPGPALRAVLGGFADEVLTGQRAVPAALQRAGFAFRHTTVDQALRAALDE